MAATPEATLLEQLKSKFDLGLMKAISYWQTLFALTVSAVGIAFSQVLVRHAQPLGHNPVLPEVVRPLLLPCSFFTGAIFSFLFFNPVLLVLVFRHNDSGSLSVHNEPIETSSYWAHPNVLRVTQGLDVNTVRDWSGLSSQFKLQKNEGRWTF